MAYLPANILNVSTQPEARLLLACAHAQPNPASTEKIETLLHAGIDWSHLLTLAKAHRMMQLLYWNVYTLAPDAVPPTVLEPLQRAFQTTARHTMMLTGELARLLALLEQRGIPAIPFKGPILAERIYGNLALRPFGDLDILVHRQDLNRARDLLVANGYTVPPTEAHKAVKRHNDCLLRRNDGQVTVELQCGIFRWPIHYPPDFAHLWERFEFVDLAGKIVRNFLPEELLLNLCVHGAKHRWERLIWICDVAELIRANPELDWQRTTQQARRLGALRMLWMGLLLAHSLLDMPLPAHILRQICADAATLALANQVSRRLFDEADSLSLVEADAPLFYLRMRERWQDRFRLYIQFYPSLFHPFQVVRKYRMSLLKPLLGR